MNEKFEYTGNSDYPSDSPLSLEEEKALQAVSAYLGKPYRDPREPSRHWAIYPQPQDGWIYYWSLPGEITDYWLIICPKYNGTDGLFLDAPMRAFLVSKKTLEVHRETWINA